ncbi:MAG: molybdopterin-dependent oxidoreductase [Campylobacteraceae bacterium]|nr:molybdopterin-dependent oxidoreductase [Campylobacteraceae bacterium]
MSLSRRGFLKTSLLGSAAAATATSALSATELFSPVEKIPHASHFGAFYAHVQDGKIIDISPQESDKNPGSLTKALMDRNYSNTRIKYPYVRKSYLEGEKDNAKLRGNDTFVRVSWNEVTKLVAEKIKTTPSENIYNATYSGWSHSGTVHSCPSLCGKFFNTVKGGAVGTYGEYSNGAAGPTNPGIVGDMEVYSLQTAHEQILENTEVYVMWGADLFKTNKIDYSVANRKNDQYYFKYKKSNIKFISIDPIMTETAKMFDAEWIKIRPNTDVAMMLGMMYHLYKTKLYDKKFVEKYTDGFDKFLPYLLGETDNIPKTPKWASDITTVPEETIEELAETFVKSKTFLAGNWAMQRAQYGEQADWGLITLAAMIGQIGTPGGGFGFSMHYSGGGQAAAGKRTPPGFAQGRNRVSTSIPASRISEALLNPGKTIDFKGNKITYPKIELMYIAGCNIVGHHPDTNELIEALKTLDTFIVQEPWWTPTAKMGDIVLPASTTLERNDIAYGGSYSGDYVYAMKKAVDNPFEAKGDYEIFSLLAKEFGDKVYKKYTDDKSEMDHIRDFYAKSDAAKIKSFEEFWESGFVKFEIPESAYKYVRHSAFRSDPQANKLSTESGKIQIFSQKYDDYNYTHFKGHVTWFEPDEYLGSKIVDKYPLHVLSPHPTFRLHSQLDNVWIKNAYKVANREPVRLNPKDARKYGIENGDIVEVYNNRGSLLAGAVVIEDIMEGVIAIEEGAWYSPEDAAVKNSRCNSGHVNVLTSSRPSSQMAQATTANTTLAGIRKASGKIIPNSAYSLPKLQHS